VAFFHALYDFAPPWRSELRANGIDIALAVLAGFIELKTLDVDALEILDDRLELGYIFIVGINLLNQVYRELQQLSIQSHVGDAGGLVGQFVQVAKLQLCVLSVAAQSGKAQHCRNKNSG